MDTRVVEYTVRAPSERERTREIVESRRASGAEGFAGMTYWQVHWAYDYDRGGGGCALRAVRATVTSRVELPRWAPSVAPDSGAAERWATFRERLAAHEAGHVRIAVQAAGEIVAALRPLRAGTCEALGELANGMGDRFLARARVRDVAYDRETRHGARPDSASGGAVPPPR